MSEKLGKEEHQEAGEEGAGNLEAPGGTGKRGKGALLSRNPLSGGGRIGEHSIHRPLRAI